MFSLNKNDLLNLKYLLVSTGIVSNEDIKDVKDEKSVFKKLEDNLKLQLADDYDKIIIEELANESFYYLKCYNNLHKNGRCPRFYQEFDWGNNFNDESIFFLRLYQNLIPAEFFHVLEKYVGINEETYINLEMDFEQLDSDRYLPQIYDWLVEKEIPFSKKVKDLLNNRIGNSNIGQEFLPTNRDIPNSKGICLIISNENFLNDEKMKRGGTKVDEKTIYDTFTKLGFDVRTKSDVKYDDMNKILEDTKFFVKEEHEMLIIFLLSHGKKNVLITSDKKELNFEDVWDPFRSSKCKILMGKPKLFFFVCCQGSICNKAVNIDDVQTDSLETVEFDSLSHLPCHPDVADFFFGFATYKTFNSFRSTKRGTFYIQCLCKIINENPSKSITDIHTEVHRKLTESKIPKQDGFQMPCFLNLLREPCYLS